jgi:hypothetical protein
VFHRRALKLSSCRQPLTHKSVYHSPRAAENQSASSRIEQLLKVFEQCLHFADNLLWCFLRHGARFLHIVFVSWRTVVPVLCFASLCWELLQLSFLFFFTFYPLEKFWIQETTRKTSDMYGRILRSVLRKYSVSLWTGFVWPSLRCQ